MSTFEPTMMVLKKKVKTIFNRFIDCITDFIIREYKLMIDHPLLDEIIHVFVHSTYFKLFLEKILFSAQTVLKHCQNVMQK